MLQWISPVYTKRAFTLSEGNPGQRNRNKLSQKVEVTVIYSRASTMWRCRGGRAGDLLARKKNAQCPNVEALRLRDEHS